VYAFRQGITSIKPLSEIWIIAGRGINVVRSVCFLFLSALILLGCFAAPAGSQTGPPASKASSDSFPSAITLSQTAQTKEKPQTPGPQAPPSPQAQSAEKKISPQEADRLFRSVDEILKFASKDTDLAIKAEVKRQLVDRDAVTDYVQKHMAEDDDAQRLRRSELVLKKFGLLPPDFDLQSFLLILLREQVAGYYDPATKTVNLLDWIDAEQQKPVLAHELTHALQDQSFSIEKYMKGSLVDLATTPQAPTAADLEGDEVATAHQAVVEGQAMVVLLDYELAPTGQTVIDSPQIISALKQGMLVGTADSVAFRNAPLYLKETLTFPYRYGLDFEADVLTKAGKDKAYAGMFSNPPHTSREIMQPETYLAGEKIPPMPVPDFLRDFKAYDRFDAGAVGEFDAALLVDQYAGVEVSARLYPHWRGGYYYAAKPKGDATAPLGVLYVSRWSGPERAAEFAAIYARGLEQRYRNLHETGGDVARTKSTTYNVQTLSGKHAWLTEQGPVFMDIEGNLVLVSESLDQTLTEQVEQELFGPSLGAK
jgi:hypothetical protein